jgi:hypothetical protein
MTQTEIQHIADQIMFYVHLGALSVCFWPKYHMHINAYYKFDSFSWYAWQEEQQISPRYGIL